MNKKEPDDGFYQEYDPESEYYDADHKCVYPSNEDNCPSFHFFDTGQQNNISFLATQNYFYPNTFDSFLNSQPCYSRFDNNAFKEVQPFVQPKKSRKRKVELSEVAQSLKNEYYSTFTTKKRFDKIYVKKIHDFYFIGMLGFNPMTREEFRRIDIYFQNYASKKDIIIKFLRANKDVISQGILKELPKKV